MPLDWLGQLKPSMKEQIALQRALLALQREDEQIRMKTMPQTAPFAERRIEARGGGPQGVAPTEGYWRPGAGSLEEALRAAQPSPGYVSGEERSRLYKEKMAAGKEELAGKAGEFWKRIEPLDDEGEKVALDAARKYQPDLYRAMVEQGYVDKATGIAVRPEKERKPIFRDTRITGGWEYEDLTFEDGTTESRILGPAAEEAVEPVTIAQQIALGEYGMKTQEFSERHRNAAIKDMGNMPRPGIDYVGAEGKEVVATAEHAQAWIEGVNVLTAYRASQDEEAPPEGGITMEGVKSMYAGRPDLISNVQQNLGIPVTGVWDEETDRQFSLYGDVDMRGAVGEAEGEPFSEKRKRAWDTWFKKWGKTFKGVTKAVKGLK